MTMQARGHKFIKILWRNPKVSWHWWSLNSGLAQPQRYCWVDKYRWRFHLTPIHLERWGEVWEIGVCLGLKTLYLYRHK